MAETVSWCLSLSPLSQIREKDYDRELKSAGVEDISHIAITFSGKDIAVKSE